MKRSRARDAWSGEKMKLSIKPPSCPSEGEDGDHLGYIYLNMFYRVRQSEVLAQRRPSRRYTRGSNFDFDLVGALRLLTNLGGRDQFHVGDQCGDG